MLIAAVIILACVILFFLIVMIRDVNRFITVEYTFQSARLKEAYTVVMLSDLHNKEFGEENERLLHAIDGLSPDCIIAAGDMLTSSRYSGCDPALALLKKLAVRCPVYYGLGNHESRIRDKEYYGERYAEYRQALIRAGVTVLENQNVTLPGTGIRIYGAEIDLDYYRKFSKCKMKPEYLDRLLGRPREDDYNILIAHNPDYFRSYAAWGADLVLSGHVHGGIMKLPVLGGVLAPSFRLFPEFDGGLFELEMAENSNPSGRLTKRSMVLGRGLGTHTIPVRVFNPGELIVIHLQPEK